MQYNAPTPFLQRLGRAVVPYPHDETELDANDTIRPPGAAMLSNIVRLPAIALLWLLHFLPLPALAVLGRGLGLILYRIGAKRRAIVQLNLAWCFPELSEAQRTQLAKSHFQALTRSLLERSIFWWSGRERLARLIRVDGEEKIHALRAAGRPVILLAPHFVGLDAGGVAMTMRFDLVSLYAAQTNPTFDRLLLKGRSRFGDQLLLSRQDGARASVKAMKAGRPLYYLPDTSARRRDSVFVPFFGIPTATITATSRLAHAANAAVLPCVTRMLPGGQGYVVEIGDAWSDYPSADVELDTTRLNAWIESVVRTMPEQYFWVHRRFKLRPLGTGEKRPY
jgi:Kdo2-lipid IVA lauroyltransferase/acyltransferase